MKAHVLLLCTPLHGHVTPTLAVVDELTGRGHRVTYVTTGEHEENVRAAGADVLRYESTWPTAVNLSDMITLDEAPRGPLLILQENRAFLDAVRRHSGDDRPDAVVYDMTAGIGARMLARDWRLPAVELSPTFASNEHFSLGARSAEEFADEMGDFDPAHPALREFGATLVELLAELGQSAVPFQEAVGGKAGLTVAALTRTFQYAGDTFGDDHVFAGPCVGDRSFQGTWNPPAGDPPVVLVSLGTTYNYDPSFFRGCVSAFTGTPWHVVLAVGTRIDPAELGELPANVEVHATVPQTAVLAHARLFVTHAGMGSAMEALHAGVPTIAIPQTPEQALIARRLEELGVGRRLPRREVTAGLLRDTAADLVADETVLARVAELRHEALAAGGAARAVDEIERYLRQD